MIDVARPFLDDAGEIVVPDDCFFHGYGIYASYYRYIDGDVPELVVLQMVNLDGRKLGKGLEDYCFLNKSNDMAKSRAKQRRENGKVDPHLISIINHTAMMPIGTFEELFLEGSSLFEDEKALAWLYYHDRTNDGVSFESENAAVEINSEALVLSEEKELVFFSGDSVPEK